MTFKSVHLYLDEIFIRHISFISIRILVGCYWLMVFTFSGNSGRFGEKNSCDFTFSTITNNSAIGRKKNFDIGKYQGAQ